MIGGIFLIFWTLLARLNALKLGLRRQNVSIFAQNRWCVVNFDAKRNTKVFHAVVVRGYLSKSTIALIRDFSTDSTPDANPITPFPSGLDHISLETDLKGGKRLIT